MLAILVAFSLISWYLIFLKWWQFRRLRRQADRFMTEIEKAARQWADPGARSGRNVPSFSAGSKLE